MSRTHGSFRRMRSAPSRRISRRRPSGWSGGGARSAAHGEVSANAGPALSGNHVAVLCARRGVRRRLRSPGPLRQGVGAQARRSVMSLDYVVGLIVTVSLLVYLTYALLK